MPQTRLSSFGGKEEEEERKESERIQGKVDRKRKECLRHEEGQYM